MEAANPESGQSPEVPGWYFVDGLRLYWDGTQWIEGKRQLTASEKAREKQQRDQAKLDKAYEKALETFWASPVGQARKAFEAGDHVFQYSINVLNQQAIIVAMIGSTTSRRHQDPSAVLNAVCREGWELVNGDFVFLQQKQQSRD